MTDKFSIAKDLRELGLLLSLKGENQFKTKAYFKGADSLEAIEEELSNLVSENRLTEISGIGKAIAAKVTELFKTGKLAALEQLRSEFPPGLIELSAVPGLSLEKALVLQKELSLHSLADLKAACKTGLVANVSGFGKKTEQKILEGIGSLETRRSLMLISDALEVAEIWSKKILRLPDVKEVSTVGQIRRWLETVDRIEILIATKNIGATKEALLELGNFSEISSDVNNEIQFLECTNSQGETFVFSFSSPERFAEALFRLTGSKGHVERIEAIAEQKKLQIHSSSETALYESLGLPYIPPELRNNLDEFRSLEDGDDFADLITIGDIKGMTHCHSTFSDGVNSIEEMAHAADQMGMKYMTCTDHSPTANYAGGLTLDELKKQWEEIERVQEKVKVKLLRGTESDILADGSLDYPDEILEQFDVIIASVHSRMKMDEEQMTTRIINCMKKPHFKIWGHALGRLLLRREPFKCRVEDILDVVAESKAAIEINGDPHRLDMAPEWLREARKRKIRFVISTDAHSTSNLHNLRFGVHMARRASIRKQEVLNTLPLESFSKAVKP
jgi:DNA polymerase (family 10)